MTPIAADKISTRPGVRIGEVHTIVSGEEPDGIDIAPGLDHGRPCIVIWAGDSDEPAVLPVTSLPALLEALASASLDATTACPE